MRKLLTFSFAMLAVMAFAMAPVYACGGDKASTAKADGKTDAKMISSTSDKATCASNANAQLANDKGTCASKANAQLANDKGSCTDKASAQLTGDKASCAAVCAGKANAQLTGDKATCSSMKGASHASFAGALESKSHEVCVVSIEGMTCGGCEESIRSTLANAPGVVKVINVSYQDGIALVAVDKATCCTTTMAKMVADKGYKAEVIPAVANVNMTKTDSKETL